MALAGASHDAAAIFEALAADPAFGQTTIIVPVPEGSAPGGDQLWSASLPDPGADVTLLIRLIDGLARGDRRLAAPICLLGFGKGARVAQELAIRHPRRAARLCLVSAGWFAMPRPDLPWPYGIGDEAGAVLAGPESPDIPTTVVAGMRDTRVDPDVPQHALIHEHQGRNRLRRARCYVRAASVYAETLGIARRPALVTGHGMSPDLRQSVQDGALIEIVAQALL